MLQKFEINGVHTNIDPALRKYVTKKIGGLDRYVSRHSRQSAHAEVYLKESKAQASDGFICEVTMHLPHQTLVVKESGLNMYAAVDIAEVRIKGQLKKYKELHGGGKLHRHLMARFKSKTA
jgi:ribosomal subunit interface protein